MSSLLGFVEEVSEWEIGFDFWDWWVEVEYFDDALGAGKCYQWDFGVLSWIDLYRGVNKFYLKNWKK